MARPRKLNVYRMPIGFHDAYVAAPSQKVAAEAWGTDIAVFARKEAELVTDPELTAEPLRRPGEVIKRLRGTAAEQIAALGDDEPAAAKGGKPAPRPKKTPKPRPSRAALDEAERALSEAEARHQEALQKLAEREAALAREREAVERKQREETARLEARRDKAAAAYEGAMRRWRES
jgi:hypothetical protein